MRFFSFFHFFLLFIDYGGGRAKGVCRVKGGTYYPITVKKHIRAQAIAQENSLLSPPPPPLLLTISMGVQLLIHRWK